MSKATYLLLTVMAFCFFLVDCAAVTMQQSQKIGFGRSNITSSTYESLLRRASHEDEDNFIYAELCDQGGSECTGKRYLTESDCFDWTSTTTKALRIHTSPAKSSLSFTLYTTSIGQTCPDQVLASQYIRKPFEGQLVTVTSNGTRFYFEKSY